MVVNAVRNIPWFTYFPDNYRWSFIVSIGLMRVAGGGADPAEIFEVCRNLEKNPGSDAHWFEEWARMGDRLRAMGMAAVRRGRNLTAAGHFCRSATYHQMADRFRFPKDKVSQGVYRKSIDSFKRYVRLNDRPKTEIVEIPYEGGKSLPGYFVHAENTRKSKPPVVVLYTGFDGTKESPMIISAMELARRGMSVVVPDTPGVGEAIRFRKIYLRHDYEVAGSAILDWLEKRRRREREARRHYGVESGGVLRAQNRRHGAPLQGVRRPRRNLGLPRDLEKAHRRGVQDSASLAGQSPGMEFQRQDGGRGPGEARRLPPRRRGAEDEVPLPAGARGRRSANTARGREIALQGGGFQGQDAPGLPGDRRRLPALPHGLHCARRGATWRTGWPKNWARKSCFV